jgi:hypothetical protein
LTKFSLATNFRCGGEAPYARLSKQLAKISHHAAMFFNPSRELSFPVLGSRHIEDGPATPSMLCNCVSASFSIIGLSLSFLSLAKARRDDCAVSYFRQAAWAVF